MRACLITSESRPALHTSDSLMIQTILVFGSSPCIRRSLSFLSESGADTGRSVSLKVTKSPGSGSARTPTMIASSQNSERSPGNARPPLTQPLRRARNPTPAASRSHLRYRFA